EFEEIRDNIFRELLNDNQRREHLYNIGINQVVMPMDDMASFQDIGIVQTCLGGTSRGKRAIAKECKIGWDDVDAISQENTRNVDEIVIDSKQFLVYSKKNIEDEQKRWQLVRLAQEIQNKGDEKIVGEYQELFDKVIEAGGYKNYIQQERMNYLGVYIINRDSDNISPKLKLKLLNAVGKVQLIHGIYGTIASCQDGSTSNCVLSISSIGYAFLSQPIEKMMVKAAPMIVKNIADIGSKIVPRILSYDTKFVVQVFGGKYGIKLAKGGAGAVASIFDIADIGISAHALIECNKRLDSNNPCSAKEIRDNIAAISFAGVSFVSGIALTAMESGPAGVVVGLVIMAMAFG
ncbi:MAG TPA: hypothetical protein LFV91_07420, partial [Rickettsia endosymbiont of Bembidion nr. Transversale]|nr:hypothetical protein [Rickettsia endosymbiont of Bembidion nr. Transversale]